MGLGGAKGGRRCGSFFEVDSRFIALAALNELFLDGKIEGAVVEKAIADLGIDAEKRNPVIS